MKFDVVIGNPPYQETRENTSDKPVYNEFMDAAYEIADKIELITPARFLFNAGKTPKEWNFKMLQDEHFKILRYEVNSKAIFSNGIDIKGGVAISFYDKSKRFKPIEIFTSFPELNTLLRKVWDNKHFSSLSTIMYSSESYKFSDNLQTECPEAYNRLSNKQLLATNVLDNLENLVFFKTKPNDNNEYIQIYGRKAGERDAMFIQKKYIKQHDNLNFYKVFVPKSNGSGALGETLSTPVVGHPVVGHTQTFLSIGKFKTEDEATAVLKYVKTKFARVLLGILKSTQHNPPGTWKYVPLQDFTNKSDIDWSKSIREIDQQLYKKYGLDENEINFIETRVKEMA